MTALKQRSDGRYCVQVYIGKVDGQRKYKLVFGESEREARKKAAVFQKRITKGLDVATEKDTFKQWGDRWLKTKKLSVGDKTGKGYDSALSYLNAALGDTPLKDIKKYNIQEVIDELSIQNPHTEKQSSKKLLSVVKQTAVNVFDYAIDNRSIDYNPAERVTIPLNAPSKKRRSLTDEEQARVVEMPHRARAAAMIMMYSGLRRGELIPLTWSDIDMAQKTISVTKAVEMVSGHPVVKDPKTEAGERLISIPDVLMAFLKELKAKSTSIYVFPSSKGEMFTDNGWRRLWESYMLDMAFRYAKVNFFQTTSRNKRNPTIDKIKRNMMIDMVKFTPHCLRHTFATIMYSAGVDLLTAKTMFGHSDVKVLLDIYTHLDKTRQKKSVENINQYLDTIQNTMQTAE